MRPITLAILIANLAFFARGWLRPGLGFEGVLAWGDLSAEAIWRGEYYRLATAAFLHADLAHLGFNLFALVALGSDLEGRLGGLRYAAVYLLSGLGGDLASILWLPSDTPTVGASGALFGVLGSHLALEMERGRSPTSFLQLPGGRGLVFYLVLSFVLGLLSTRINNAAHAGGFAAGFGATRLLFAGRFLAGRRTWAIRIALLALTAEAGHYALFSVGRPGFHYRRAERVLEAGGLGEAESALRAFLVLAPRAALAGGLPGADPWEAGRWWRQEAERRRARALLGYVRAARTGGKEGLDDLELAGADPFALFWAAYALRRGGRGEEARGVIEELEEALTAELALARRMGDRIEDALAERLAGLAALARAARGGPPAKARRAVEEILGRREGGPEGLLARALVALAAGERESAERFAEGALGAASAAPPGESGPFPRFKLRILYPREIRGEAARLLALARGGPPPALPPPHPIFEFFFADEKK